MTTPKDKTKPVGYTFGRPSSCKPEYANMMREFFDVETYTTLGDGKRDACDFPTLAGFCRSINTHRGVLFKWLNTKTKDGEPAHPNLVDAMAFAKECQEEILVINASHGLYHAGFAGLMAKNIINWTEKVESRESVVVREVRSDMEAKEATNAYMDAMKSD